ncbi:glutamate racemase [Ferrimonas gelatinilytica]|uniref:Glutamate racemase n=1 Tax=Ferrimonas gelatinilytica TaxID=1255257 RepID=A0ABP9SCB0_9GAMM
MGSILLFDSGLGGLSVYRHIREVLPKTTIHYVEDNARFPYGELGDQELIDGCCDIIASLTERLAVDLVVVACNSASTLVLEPLRQRLSQPVVGVVPAIKPAAQSSKLGVIGLLATPGTVQRRYTDELIQTYAPEHTVIRVGSSELVHMAEGKLAGVPVDLDRLYDILAPIRMAETVPDHLILGCTHFPLIAEEIGTVLGSDVVLVDSGAAIARRVVHQLSECRIECSKPTDAGTFFYTGTVPEALLQQHLKNIGFGHIKSSGGEIGSI